VVLGNAFNKIVTSLVNSVIMPLIGLATGGASIADWKWVITEANEELGITENAVHYGVFLQAIIDFLIIAITLFIAMKIVKFSRNKIEKTKTLLQKEIKSLTNKEKKKLKKQGVDVEKLEEAEGETKVEDLVKKEETPAPAPEPTKEEKLLTEIRDLLAGKYIAQPVEQTVKVEEPKT
ncbi:MAG: MscL family protein, partial [Clostridia bacterium]|nr:MscL family protein [Clostridia bacterium]